MSDYLLFGTAGCHLCEEAEILLHQAGIIFTVKDIIESEALQQQYGLLIPVLLHVPSQRSLCWPFDQCGLLRFIQNIVL